MDTELAELIAKPPPDFNYQLAALYVQGQISSEEHRLARLKCKVDDPVNEAIDEGMFLSRKDFHDLRSAAGNVGQALEFIQVGPADVQMVQVMKNSIEAIQKIVLKSLGDKDGNKH
jgi:hypothetical protein